MSVIEKVFGPEEVSREEIVDMLRDYWNGRPRTEKAAETAKRIGVSTTWIYAVLKGTRTDIGSQIPAFFGYAPDNTITYHRMKKRS